MPDTKPPLKPRKTPRQARSQATCEAILEAAARILEQGGLPALTTNRIAELAGVSIGSLYQYFPSKEAILAEMVRRMRAEMCRDVEQAVAEVQRQSLSVAVDAILRASMQHHFRYAERAFQLEQAEAQLPPDAETLARKEGMARMIVGVLAHHGVPEPEVVTFDLSALTKGMVEAATHAGESDFEGLFLRVRKAVTGYLTNTMG